MTPLQHREEQYKEVNLNLGRWLGKVPWAFKETERKIHFSVETVSAPKSEHGLLILKPHSSQHLHSNRLEEANKHKNAN